MFLRNRMVKECYEIFPFCAAWTHLHRIQTRTDFWVVHPVRNLVIAETPVWQHQWRVRALSKQKDTPIDRDLVRLSPETWLELTLPVSTHEVWPRSRLPVSDQVLER